MIMADNNAIHSDGQGRGVLSFKRIGVLFAIRIVTFTLPTGDRIIKIYFQKLIFSIIHLPVFTFFDGSKVNTCV